MTDTPAMWPSSILAAVLENAWTVSFLVCLWEEGDTSLVSREGELPQSLPSRWQASRLSVAAGFCSFHVGHKQITDASEHPGIVRRSAVKRERP